MTTTHIVLLFVFVSLLIYTALAGRMGVQTISKVMRDSAWKWSIIPYILGLLMGHWFWNNHGGSIYGWGWGIPMMVITVGKDIFRYVEGNSSREWWNHPAIYASIGIGSGFCFWTLTY